MAKRRKKMKKISQIVLYSLLGAVVLAVILCSFIKISFKPQVNMPTTAQVGKVQIVATSGVAQTESNFENIKIEEFNKKFNSAFELSVLYSLFSGKIGNGVVMEDDLSALPNGNGYKVLFIYHEDQTLKIDGKEVPIADNSSTPVKYNRVVFYVTENAGLGDVTMYFYTQDSGKYYVLKTIANFDELYKHISQMSMFAE